jgi:DUF971 family protein
MQPLDIQPIGEEIAIKWDDNTETYIPLEKLRRACACATCKGEMDITGKLYKGPDQPLTPASFKLTGFTRIGTYAIQFFWADGHSTGIYSFEYLKRVAEVVD